MFTHVSIPFFHKTVIISITLIIFIKTIPSLSSSDFSTTPAPGSRNEFNMDAIKDTGQLSQLQTKSKLNTQKEQTLQRLNSLSSSNAPKVSIGTENARADALGFTSAFSKQRNQQMGVLNIDGGVGSKNQYDGSASSYGPSSGGMFGTRKKPSFASPVEICAVSGYDIVFDSETVPIFELTGSSWGFGAQKGQSMRAANIAGVFKALGTFRAHTKSTGFTSLQNQVKAMREMRQMDKTSSLGVSGSGSAMSTFNLGMQASLTKSSSVEKMNSVQSLGMHRFSRISVVVPAVTVKLTRQNMQLQLGFLQDLKRLPIIPGALEMVQIMDGHGPNRNINKPQSVADFLTRPELKDVISQYFDFFRKYGTHYRARPATGAVWSSSSPPEHPLV